MKVVRYEKPIIKKAAEMKAGDIFRTEYGDFGNWCEFVFESCNDHFGRTTETHYHRIGQTESCKCYGMASIDKAEYEVIGREESEDENV